MTCYRDIVNLTAGQASYTASGYQMFTTPRGARGDILKQGGGAANIFVTADYTSLSANGGTFYFSAPIPSDGTIYKLLFEFLP